MNLTILFQAISVLSKASLIIKTPDLIKKIIELVIVGIIACEIEYKDLTGKEQKQKAIDFINVFYDLLDIQFVFNDDIDKFVKNDLIPKLIDVLVYYLKRFGLMKKAIDEGKAAAVLNVN